MALRVVTIGDGAMATVSSLIVAGKNSAENPVEVRIWGRDAGRLGEMERMRENTRYLAGTKIPPNIHFTADPAELFSGADVALIIAAVPTQFMRGALEHIRNRVPPGVPVVSVAKGIEITTLKRPTEIIREVLGQRPIAALSGPSIAAELARKLPATMVVATENTQNAKRETQNESGQWAVVSGQRGQPETGDTEVFAKWVQELFTTAYLRVYRNEDLRGVEFAGAMKNVIAIAAGILDGLCAGNNAKAALLTRGLVEITRLGVALGAQSETFAGLAGLGDLVTTCVSPEGRNRSFGERIGRGEKPGAVLADMVGVVEGVPTCESMIRLARQMGIAMPICEGLHAVLFHGHDPREEIAVLMARELKRE